MKTVLIVNAGIRAQGKSGKLNEEMTRLAREAFEAAGVKTLLTDLNNEWTLEEEIEKILAADADLGDVDAQALHPLAGRSAHAPEDLRHGRQNAHGPG